MGFENGIFQLIILIPMYYWRKQKNLITGLKEKNKFYIFQLKHMLLVLKRTVLMKWFF